MARRRETEQDRAITKGSLGWFLALMALLPAPALAFDPELEWQTLVTPRFRVHYPVGLAEQAQVVAASAERAFDELSERLAWTPSLPLDLVLADETDSANGSAQSVPYNLIVLNAVAPAEISDLGDYDDWTYTLVAHELAHIVHIDTVVGLPAWFNAVFGRWFTPNGIQPAWLVEGLATYFESALTSAGRVRSPYFDMMLRMAVLDEVAMDLDVVSGAPRAWPQGSVPYLYGGRFVDYLVQRFGEDILAKVSHDYGGRLVPFALNASVSDATGVDYGELYEDFVAHLAERYRAQREAVWAAGRVEGELLTQRGQEIGPARVGKDGTIYFVEASVGERASLKALTAAGERAIARIESGARLALIPGEEAALVVQLEVSHTYHFYGDVFRVDLLNGSTRRLTHGARIQAIDVAADGEQVVFAQLDGAHAVIKRAPLHALREAVTLADLGPMTQVWSPRFAPDGQSVVFAGFVAGRRDLFRVPVAGGKSERLTHDTAVDGGVAFTPDGRYVVYHSDRDGIFNVYALPTAGGEPRRLTRVVGGAFEPEPAPDGRSLIYRAYGPRGFDLARLDLPNVDDINPAEPLVETRTRRDEPPALHAYPARPYSAWPTILPRAWLPVLTMDSRGDAYGVALYGQDAVARHLYTAQAWWGSASDFVGFDVAYLNQTFFPGLFAQLHRSLGYAAMPYVRDGVSLAVEEELWLMLTGSVWPLWTRRRGSLTLSTVYEMQVRHAVAPFAFEPAERAPVFPDQGRFGALRLSLAASNVRSYIDSISPEEGGRVTLGLRVEDPAVGSEYSAVSGTADAAVYIENPWLRRHVLALAGTAGYGKSNYARRRLFALGGLPQRDVLLDLLNGFWVAPSALRGFPLAPFAGDVMVAGHGEYRLPLFDVDRGVETLPFFVRVVHAAAFVDAAALADSPGELAANQHYAAGGELRADLLVAYALPVTVRLGYGRGLGRDQVSAVFLVLGQAL